MRFRKMGPPPLFGTRSLSPHTPRRLAGCFFKRAGKTRFAFIPELLRDLGLSLVGIAQPVAGDFEPPLSQVSHRSLADEISKSCREARAGDPDGSGKSFHRPRMRRVAMNET